MPETDDIQVVEETEEEEVIRPKMFTPLFIVPREYCVRAYHPREANLYIESLGRGAIKRGEIPADQWRVLETKRADPVICGLDPKTPSRQKLWGRYNRMNRMLGNCPPEDATCIKRRTTLLNKYTNMLRNEPKQCYCGQFEFLQSQMTRQQWFEEIGVPMESDIVAV